MMDIICILGSPHGQKGNTAALTEIVLDGARSLGANCETIVLTPDRVRPCLGCDTCHMVGACPQDDGFAEILTRVQKADGVVLASPNYIFSVSAQMKAFIDRCCGVIHCMGFGGKYGVSVVTSGGGGDEPIIDYLNHFMLVTGAQPVGGIYAAMNTLVEATFPDDLCQQAIDLGRSLVQAWEAGEVRTEYTEAMAAFRDRMRSLIVWHKDAWPYEYAYWKKHYGMQ